MIRNRVSRWNGGGLLFATLALLCSPGMLLALCEDADITRMQQNGIAPAYIQHLCGWKRPHQPHGSQHTIDNPPFKKEPEASSGGADRTDDIQVSLLHIFQKLIPGMSNARLIAEARRLDMKLRHPEGEVGRREKEVIAETLLTMYETLAVRIEDAPRNDNGLPMVEGVRWKTDSPRAGRVKDIVPFERIDWWVTFLSSEALQKKSQRETAQSNSFYSSLSSEEYGNIFQDVLDVPEVKNYVDNVRDRLILHTKSKVKHHIKVSRTTLVNGFADFLNDITVTRGMLHAIFNEDELACYIGHEVGHIELAHIGSSQGNEEEADKYGVLLCQRAGYQPHALADLFDRLAQLVAKQAERRARGDNRTHKSLRERAYIIRDFLRQRGIVNSGERESERYQRSLAILHELTGFMDDAVRLEKPLWSAISSIKKIEGPDFLGPSSKKTLGSINKRLASNGLLKDMLTVGPLIVLFTTTIVETAAGGGYPLELQANAVAAIPKIGREVIDQEINLLLNDPEDLSAAEIAYWNGILSRLK